MVADSSYVPLTFIWLMVESEVLGEIMMEGKKMS
jgi:hypothetical protein